MTRIRRLVAGAFVACVCAAFAAEAAPPSGPTPPVVTPPLPATARGVGPNTVLPHGVSRPPTLQTAGPCGPGQMQCYLGGGVVPPNVSSNSPDAARHKVCVMAGDPRWGCGTCTRNVFWKVEGVYCSPKTNTSNYTTCSPHWEDRDGNRSNGCEQWVTTKRPDGWQRAAPATPASGAACWIPNPPGLPGCGSNPDIKCVLNAGRTTDGSCQWYACDRVPDRDGACSYLLPLDHNDPVSGFAGCLGVGAPGADSHGCGWRYPSCPPFQTAAPGDGHCYSEDPYLFDADHDGHVTMKLLDVHGDPKGDDCDDGDPSRFPGNQEVCDTFGHDEDCNPQTNGAPDADGDGLPDGTCCNTTATGARFCGTDCDDHNAGLALQGKRCVPNGQMQICTVDTSNGGRVASWVTRSCAAGLTCNPNPDGTGDCGH
jgi:hypothetical protein